MADDLIIAHASELVTLKGPRRARQKEEMSQLSIVRDGALAISNGVIVEVGKTEAILRSHKSARSEVIDASGQVVMPGFVDPHTHLVFAGSREFELELKAKGKSYMDILEEGGGILRTVKDTRAASSDELFEQSGSRLEVMLAHGSTTVEAKSGYGLDRDVEILLLETVARLDKESPVDLVPTYLGAHAIPPEYEGRASEYIDFIIAEVMPIVAKKKLAVFCDVFCEKGVFSAEDATRILLAGKELGMIPKVHADEFSSSGGAEVAAEVGAISADHLGRTSDDGIMAMARKDVSGVLLPGTTYASMSKDYADGRRLIDLGVPVALGTDLCPNSWNQSMQFVMSLACFQMRLTPAEAVTAATFNAAAALGLERKIGSLERGKRADIVLLDVPAHAQIPYRYGVNLCSTVIKDGKTVWTKSPFKSSG